MQPACQIIVLNLLEANLIRKELVMALGTTVAPPSKALFWTGCVLSALPALLLIMSGVMKLIQPPGMADGFEHLGWPMKLAPALGVLELACAVLYVIPKTSVLGAILMTGYFGGAIATHVRIEEHAQIITIAIAGILTWLGLYCRDARLRALAPLRS